MPHRALRRFESWLGHWRGSGTFPDGPADVELTFRPLFGGSALEVTMAASYPNRPHESAVGVTLWTAGPDGKLEATVAHPTFGALELAETPDDPGVVAFESRLPDNAILITTFAVDGNQMIMTTSRRQGYVGSPRTPRIHATLQRLQPVPLDRQP